MTNVQFNVSSAAYNTMHAIQNNVAKMKYVLSYCFTLIGCYLSSSDAKSLGDRLIQLSSNQDIGGVDAVIAFMKSRKMDNVEVVNARGPVKGHNFIDMSPALAAILKGNTTLLKQLVDAGAELPKETSFGSSLFIAIGNANPQHRRSMVQYILSQNFPVDFSSLQLACTMGDKETLSALIAKADPALLLTRDVYNNVFIRHIYDLGDPQLLAQALVKQPQLIPVCFERAMLERKEILFTSLLMKVNLNEECEYVIKHGTLEQFNQMVAAGMEVDRNGFLPLVVAAAAGRADMIGALLNTAQVDAHGSNLLHAAAKLDNFMNIVIMFNKREVKLPNVNAQDERGDTPLHVAARFKNRVAMQWLLDNGARANVGNLCGELPINYLDSSDQELIAILRDNGAYQAEAPSILNSLAAEVRSIFTETDRLPKEEPIVADALEELVGDGLNRLSGFIGLFLSASKKDATEEIAAPSMFI